MQTILKTSEKNSCRQPWQAGLGLCQQIKARISLREVGRRLGFDLPERDNVKFRSPLRPDNNPSCTISGEIMRDWSRSESFDAIGLYAAAKGITNREAIFYLGKQLHILSDEPRSFDDKKAAPSSLVTFDGREPTEADISSILQARRLPPDAEGGLWLANSLGVLHFADVTGRPCWLVADEARRCADARRLDGNLFPSFGNLGERKAHSLKGSIKKWPIGLSLRVSDLRAKLIRKVPIVLVEGGPDLLAAYTILGVLPMSAGDVQPVGMMGEAEISPEAVGLMSQRRVLIFAHRDDAGRGAAKKWANQLRAAFCTVTVRELSGGQDLNDCVSANGLAAAIHAFKP